MKTSRLLKVCAELDRYSIGSGYLVTDRFVLTAAHVVCPPEAATTSNKVKVSGSCLNGWVSADVVWFSRDHDAALLEISPTRQQPVILGRLPDKAITFRWEGGGFARAGKSKGVLAGDSVGISGSIEAFGGAVSKKLDLTVDKLPPGDIYSWKGISGGPVFVHGTLVGVISSFPQQFQGGTFYATAIATLLEIAECRDLLSATLVYDLAELNATVPPTGLNAYKANTGTIVSKLCDRLKQVNAFDTFFRECVAKQVNKPQFYLLPGVEGEGHDSLIERLIDTRITHFASQLWGQAYTKIDGKHTRVPWPITCDIVTQRKHLPIALFREFNPDYIDENISVDAFAKLQRFSQQPLVVIQHDLYVTQWCKTTAALIDWYINDFWSSLKPDTQQPLFLIFLIIIYPKRADKGLCQWLKLTKQPEDIARRQIVRIKNMQHQCPLLVFDELGSVTVEDVKRWFKDNGICGSTHKRLQLTQKLFKDVETMPMEEIVDLLDEILIDVRKEIAMSYGRVL